MKGLNSNQLKLVAGRARTEAINPGKAYDGTDGVWNWFEDVSNVRLANARPQAPRATASDPNDNDRVSDRYIEDGSYLRIRDVTLGYSFPPGLVRRCKIETLRLSVNVRNLHTFTRYSGFDPEVGLNTSSPHAYGLDNGRYPSPQIYALGLLISF
jgi:hypothetical protein